MSKFRSTAFMRKMLITGAAAACALFCMMTAFAAEISDVPAQTAASGRQSTEKEALQTALPDGTILPEDAGLLVDVAMTGSEAAVRVYERQERTVRKGPGETASGTAAVWKEVISATGHAGRSGIGKEKEGDGKTPEGLFRLNTPFGNAPREEGFPEDYRQVTDDLYWVSDTASPVYNRLVSRKDRTDFRTSSGEHLIDCGAYYSYCLNIDYNPECIPGKGSALFLHCDPKGETTSGCVAVPAESMRQILKLYRNDASYIRIRRAE